MTLSVSLGTMITQLDALTDTNDLSEWEEQFILDIGARTSWGKVTTQLTEKQLDCLETLWRKHFA